MVLLKVVGGLLIASAAISSQTTNGVDHSTQDLSISDAKELQSASSKWTAGVVKSFKKQGITIQETTDTEHALIPVKLREQAEEEHAKFYKINWDDTPNVIKGWIKANPWQTAFFVVNGVVFFAPAAASGPILWILGYTSVGPRAASFATFLHSKIGVAAAKGGFAYLQSAGMGGYGVAVVNTATQCTTAAIGLGAGLWGWASGNRTASLFDSVLSEQAGHAEQAHVRGSFFLSENSQVLG
ncbi:hypothetical protein SBOR_4236 [Sclerotinia borealis F-4128]|uniref:Uncharacterized protein n=1 Tax=Sclerotinia borealis (strain F-4128) TaxID=1432307 RepID=W9CLK9_SCLBF|nr:hypothetical protein SBOR_4236 [Sclerotinia borealis F-4128]